MMPMTQEEYDHLKSLSPEAKAKQEVRMKTQTVEFDQLEKLWKAYNAMPAIVDDSYPEYRHYYEREIRTFIHAIRENGRIQ